MEIFIWFYHGIVLFSGLAAILLTAALFRKYRLKILREYLVFLTLFSLLTAFTSFGTVFLPAVFETDPLLAGAFLDYFWYPFMGLASAYFFRRMAGYPVSGRLFFIFSGIFLVFIAMACYPFLSMQGSSEIRVRLFAQFAAAGGLFILAITVSGIIFLLRSFQAIPKGLNRRILAIALIFLGLFLIGLWDETALFRKAHLELTFPVSSFFFSIYYFLWNSATVIIAVIHLISIVPGRSGSIENLPENLVRQFAVTAREREIIGMLLRGFRYRQIAEALFISYPTVKTHVNNIYQKFSVSGKFELLSLVSEFMPPETASHEKS